MIPVTTIPTTAIIIFVEYVVEQKFARVVEVLVENGEIRVTTQEVIPSHGYPVAHVMEADSVSIASGQVGSKHR